MKRISILLIFVLFYSLPAYAQKAQVNETQADIYSTEGEVGPVISVDLKGNLYTKLVDSSSGLSQSVIPLSESIGLNGTLVGPVLYNNWEAQTDTIETGSTTTVLNLTSHVAKVGDVIIFKNTTGNVGVQIPVKETTANTVTLVTPLSQAPANGDAIAIVKPMFLAGSYNRTSGGNYGPSLNVSLDSNTQYQASTGLLKLEDAAHTTGDAGVQSLAVRNEGASQFADGNGDYSPIAVQRAGAVYVALSSQFGDSAVDNQAVRAEDTAFGAGGAVVMSGGVNNRGYAAFNSTAQDITPIGVGDAGNVFSTLTYDAQLFGGFSPITKENNTINASDSVVLQGMRAVSAIDQTVTSSGQATYPSVDLGNRLVTTSTPSGQMVVGCNTAVTTATTGTVIAAVASQFTFITSLSCTNTGAAATRVILEDGDGTDLANVMLAATTGFAHVSFPTPVRTNVVNRAIQINVITTSSSTICCASGYTGVI